LINILRGITVQEHEIDRALALGIEVPPARGPAEGIGRHQVKDSDASR
jgi:hypothetical protein